MKRWLTILLVLTAASALTCEAFALLIPYSKERIAAHGKHCVGGYDGNFGATGTYYAGDVAALNEQLAALAKTNEESPKTVIIHPGTMLVPRYLEADRDLSTDWLVTTWPGRGDERPVTHLQVDIWLGSRIKLADLRIPTVFDVQSGDEIQAFIDQHKKLRSE
jgi:hypothetical protein